MPKVKLSGIQAALVSTVKILAENFATQNIPIDENTLMVDLQQLVLKHGGDNTAVASLLPPPILPTEKYNLAGDLIIKAQVDWANGNKTEALKILATAMETPGIDELLLAINNANDIATIGMEGLASISQETEIELADLVEDEEITAELDDEIESILADGIDFDDNEKPSTLRRVVERRKSHTELSREQKALANKLSQSGREKDREIALGML